MSAIDFTPGAVHALRLAQESAAQLGHSYVGCEHLLLGIARETRGPGATTLSTAGLHPELLRRTLIQMAGIGCASSLPAQGLTPNSKKCLENALILAGEQKLCRADTGHLLTALLQDTEGTAVRMIRLAGKDPEQLNGQPQLERSTPPRREMTEQTRSHSPTKLLDQYSRDLSALAAADSLDPVIGRESEVHRVMEILSRRRKNNPALIGEPGVGKTAIAEALAMALLRGEGPKELNNARVVALDISSMIAGTKYRGEFEDRIHNILKEIRQAENIILFLDELHTIVGAGSAEGAIDAANILKPALGRGDLRVIGATTTAEYRRYIESDAALERRFQPVIIQEPTPNQTRDILIGLRSRYEQHHGLTITDAALSAAVELSIRYLPDRRLPDKAVDLMDEAASRCRLAKPVLTAELEHLKNRAELARRHKEEALRTQRFEQASVFQHAEQDFRHVLTRETDKLAGRAKPLQVQPRHVAEVISSLTGIPPEDLTRQERTSLLELEAQLSRSVIGQPQPIRALAQAICRGRTGLKEENRPVGSFLFLGPTGVGKTELCKALAQSLFGSEKALIRFDMSEYAEKHTISRLVGSPPGYVGHEEGGQLTEAVRRNPYSIILFDEIEKAHPEIWNLLLQVTEDGALTDSLGRKADFRNCILILTSNVGAKQLTNTTTLGFTDRGTVHGQRSDQELKSIAMEEVRHTFRPEFLNRLDDILVFRQLDRATLQSIARNMLSQLGKRLLRQNIALKYSAEAVELLIDLGYDPTWGARPLRRVIREQVENPAAALLLSGALTGGNTLDLSAVDGKIKLMPQNVCGAVV